MTRHDRAVDQGTSCVYQRTIYNRWRCVARQYWVSTSLQHTTLFPVYYIAQLQRTLCILCFYDLLLSILDTNQASVLTTLCAFEDSAGYVIRASASNNGVSEIS